MATFFSASTLWFYNDSDKAKYESGIGWPTDAVELSDDEVLTYTQTAPVGYVLGADASGKAAWIAAPTPDQAELVAAAETKKTALRAEADAAIAPLQDAVSLNMASEEEAASYDSWRQYRVLLNRVDTSQALAIEWPIKPD